LRPFEVIWVGNIWTNEVEGKGNPQNTADNHRLGGTCRRKTVITGSTSQEQGGPYTLGESIGEGKREETKSTTMKVQGRGCGKKIQEIIKPKEGGCSKSPRRMQQNEPIAEIGPKEKKSISLSKEPYLKKKDLSLINGLGGHFNGRTFKKEEGLFLGNVISINKHKFYRGQLKGGGEEVWLKGRFLDSSDIDDWGGRPLALKSQRGGASDRQGMDA